MREIPAKQLIKKIIRFSLWAVLGFIFFVNSPYPALSHKTPDTLNVRVAVLRDFPPLYLLDNSGKPAGFAISILGYVAKKTNLKVHYMIFENWAKAMEAVRTGRADFIPGIGISDARMAEFAFTEKIETIPVSCFVRSNNHSIKGIEDLSRGYRTAVINESAAMTKMNPRKGINLVPFPNIESALFKLLSGDVDAFVFPKPVLKKKARMIGVAGNIKVVGKPLMELKRGYLLRKNDTNLLAKLNSAIKEYTLTEEYIETYKKWYGKPRPFWTAKKTALFMSGMLSTFIILMLIWHYFSVLRINRRLVATIKGKKKAEKALRLTNFLLNRAGEATFLAEIDMRLVYVNQEACRSLGYSKEELLSMIVSDVDIDVTEEIWEKQWNQIKQQNSVTFESHHRKKNGEVFPVEITTNYLNFEGREFVCGFVRNITVRKQAEEELCERTHLNQILLDAFPCVALLLTPDHEVVISNKTGRNAGAVTGKKCFKTFGQRNFRCPWCLAPEALKTGKAQHIEVEALGIVWDAHWIPIGPDLYLHYAFDITERKRAENEIKEKTEQLHSLYETGKKISSIVSKDELLPWIVEQAPGLLNTDSCHFRIRKGNYLLRAAGTRGVPNSMVKDKIRIGESISGTIAKEKKPIIVKDMRNEPRLIKEHGEAARKHNLMSCLGVPMIAGNDVVGVIFVTTRKPREFNQKDIKLLSSFADMAAIAIKNADLFNSLEHARKRLEKSEKSVKEFSGKILSVREEEKKRLATDLHDELASMVVALEMNLSIAEKNVQKNDLESAAENINKSRNLLKNAAGNLRSIVKQLRPPNLDINGLPEALKEYFADVKEQMKINIDFAADTNGKKFDDETSIVLFRVAQESVNNVIRHAHAKNITIKLSSENGHINFFVCDDGKGFHAKTNPQKTGSLLNMGVIGMRERVESLGGTFDIQSGPNRGTEIKVTVPNKKGK